MQPIEDIREFCEKRDAGECCTISEELFNYFLGVLPPIYMNRNVELVDGDKTLASFGFAEGWERITAFWRTADGWYLAQHTTEINGSNGPFFAVGHGPARSTSRNTI